MSDGLTISSVAFRPPETNTEARQPTAVQVNDESTNDLAEAVFISPVAELDVDTNLVLFQFRDTSSGEITRQFPSDQRISSYQNGTALSPTELANFVANIPQDETSVAAQESADAVDELQSGPELSGITTPDDAVAPTTIEAATDTASAPNPTEQLSAPISQSVSAPSADDVSGAAEPPPAPEPVVVSSGQPSNGVSDVTDTGTDASAGGVGEGEVRTLAASE